jgi:hypothetical protein
MLDEARKEELIRNARKDGFIFTSNDVNDVMWLLGIISDSTTVHEVRNPKVTRAKKGDVRLFNEEYKALHIVQSTISDPNYSDDSLEADYEECANNTGLLISADGGETNYLTRDTAFGGICDITRVKGRGLTDLYRMDIDMFIQTVNNLLTARSGSPVTFIEVMGRTTGVASGMYRHMDQKKLLQSFLVAAADKNGSLVNFNYSHELTYAVAEFPPELVQTYAIDRLGFDPAKAKMQMVMKNSVTRSSAARVYFIIREGDKEISALGAYTAHKGNSAIEAFAEACLGMHAALTQTVDALLDLSNIKLNNAESTIREVARRCGLSDRKMVEEIKSAKRAGKIDFGAMTAYEGYLFLNNVINDAQLSKSKVKGFSGNTDLIASYVKTEIKARIAVQHWGDIDQTLFFDEVTVTPAQDVDPRQISLLPDDGQEVVS